MTMADTPAPTGWLTPTDDDLVELWPGSVDLSEDALATHLDAARTQCEDFAPTLAEGTPVPSAWRLAQALQARALARAGIVGTDNQTGIYGEGVTVFPMDWTVKALLRPKRGKPVVA